MNNTDKFSHSFDKLPCIAILRGIAQNEICQVCDILHDAGIDILEVPMNTPNAAEVISTAVKYCGDRQVVGAGTVLTCNQVEQIAEKGAQFIISPNTNPEVIRATKEAGLVSIPGFYTPTEAFIASDAGADYLKLFPAGHVDAFYINDIKTVLSTPIIATGGITQENIPMFLKVCAGVSLASCLYKAGQSMKDTKAQATILASIIAKNRKIQ